MGSKDSKIQDEDLSETVKRIEDLLFLIVQSQKDSILEPIVKIFGHCKKRVEVYIQLDGRRTASKIGKILGMKKQNVSAEIKVLLNTGLIELSGGAGSPYKRKRVFEMLGLLGVLRKSM